MTDLVLDPARSRVRIHTFAEGLLARLAHDLELVCGALSGTASGHAGAGDARASIEAPLSGMSVTGILGKDGRVDEQGLSANERREVMTKMQKDVFHAGADAAVRVEGQLDGGTGGMGGMPTKARLRVIPPAGKPFEAVVPVTVRAEAEGGVHATGSLDVSLSAIGSDPLKGPMGAFRIKDKVKVTFDLMFTPRA